jgi:hypothetical protein
VQRRFRGEHPGFPSVRPGFLFFKPDDRLAGADDLLFIGLCGAGVFRGKEIEIRFPDRLLRGAEPEPDSLRQVDAEKPAVQILKVDLIGNGIEQRP